VRLEGIVSFGEAVHIAGLRYGTDLVVEVARGSIEVGQSIVLRHGIPLTVERVRDRGSDDVSLGLEYGTTPADLARFVACCTAEGVEFDPLDRPR
jgi:hypothetical protein